MKPVFADDAGILGIQLDPIQLAEGIQCFKSWFLHSGGQNDGYAINFSGVKLIDLRIFIKGADQVELRRWYRLRHETGQTPTSKKFDTSVQIHKRAYLQDRLWTLFADELKDILKENGLEIIDPGPPNKAYIRLIRR